MDLEYYEISVPDRNDSIMRVNLDEVYYNLRLTWNAYGGFWMLSIYDAEMNIILGMARLVPGTIWNFYYQTQGGPPGVLGVETEQETIGRNDFVDGKAKLLYLPAKQLGVRQMDIWDRQYRVRIGKNNSVGREIGKPNEKTKRAIRCSFSCEIGDSSSSNTGKITLWNLADETLRLLEQEDCLIELRAGYGDDLPVIMGGSLTCFETETNGADRQTTIEFVDSFTSARDTTVSLSYSGVVNGEKIVRDVAQEMGCEVKLSPKAKMIDFKNFAFVGTGKTLIGRLCDRSKLRWSVQNGIVQICALDEPLTMAAYVLSADSGMIGSPKPFFESASTSSKSSTSKNASSNTTKRKAKKGIEVTYCLNGHIQIDDYVKVESREDKGNYRASKIRFIGDTEGDDWQCVGQFVEVK